MKAKFHLRALLAPGIVLAMVAGCFAAGTDSSNPGISLAVTPAKDRFAAGEPVVLSFRIRNDGPRPVLVSRVFTLDRHVSLQIKNKKGKLAKWCGRIASLPWDRNSFTVLSPGESVEAHVVITCAPDLMGGYNLREPGKYRGVATYYLSEPSEVLQQIAGSAQVWKGPLLSSSFQITVGGRRTLARCGGK